MADGITGQGTTYNLPNFVGELFATSPEDTPFLSAIGGLTGGESANAAPLFTWQTYDLRDAAGNRQRLEGAAPPDAEARVRGNGSNVLEIHQEAVELSYTKMATRNYISGGAKVAGSNPVGDEMSWQLTQAFKQVARDVNLSFLTNATIAGSPADVPGTIPADNTKKRRTRGLLEAITSNVVTVTGDFGGAGDPATEGELLTAEHVLDAMQKAWENGGWGEAETRTLMTNATLKRRLTKLFISDKGYEESTRNVGGVNLQTIETDFGRVNIMLERAMPSDTLAIVSLGECAPVFLEIPGKGHFFAEPLAKTGAADKVQLYGEIGLKYGLEAHHAKVVLNGTDTSE